MSEALIEYKNKRDFSQTAEPTAKVDRSGLARFVIQEHHASRLHYDLRLEMDGVLKSWAVPKGPSFNPKDKRLAVQTEDHPVAYLEFEGHIPEGNYGAGDMTFWDHGHYALFAGTNPVTELETGQLKLEFFGERMRGKFALVKMKKDEAKEQWLLIKEKDEFVDTPDKNCSTNSASSPVKQANKPSENAAESAIMRKGKASAILTDIKPMLAVPTPTAFDDKDWLFELKWDGFRAICTIDNGNATIVSRNGHSLTTRYPTLNELPAHVSCTNAVLDGELVAIDTAGKPNFQKLQPRWKGTGKTLENNRDMTLVYFVFDVLYYNGLDVTQADLVDRKTLLQKIVSPTDTLRISEHVLGSGISLFQTASEQSLEGVVAKRARSAYQQKRSNDWLKIKSSLEQDVVICGYTEPRNDRKYIGALIAGVYEDGKLVYAGHVGAGSRENLLKQLHEAMAPLASKVCSLSTVPKTNEPVHWVEPSLVGSVKFAEWTDEGNMRQPIFLGLRDDKNPSDCTRTETRYVAPNSRESQPASADQTGKNKSDASAEHEIGDVKLELTNLGKVYWPDSGITKGDLLHYYEQISECVLPYLKDRPLILKRYPNGIDKPYFYQHDLDKTPDFVKAFARHESGHEVCYAVCDNLDTLLYITNLGSIALNPMHSRTITPNNPDWIVFDLDPQGSEWKVVCDVAICVRDVLSEIGLTSYAKTSGSRGIHVYVPIAPRYDYAESLALANLVASVVETRMPSLVSTERLIKKRTPKSVYLDCYQNSPGKTVAGPYSARERPGATVSTPLTWDEVARNVDRAKFNIFTVPDRIKDVGDLFAPVLMNKQTLSGSLERLARIVRV